MARLFTAVELSTTTRDAVVARRAEIAAAIRAVGDRDLRLTPTTQLHLTLAFIGEVDEEHAAGLQRALSSGIEIDPFTVELGACGTFPAGGPARVLWLGVSRGRAELGRIYEILSGRLESVGVARERRPYQPHLTIGRWRAGGHPSIRRALPTNWWVASQLVDHVTLFRSRLLPGGAEHTAIAYAPLRSVGT
jgi:2'-5' RNA ligase